ncbi:MAG: ParB/RepB/Spo0J family partition protein [Pirellulaceae bacterium]
MGSIRNTLATIENQLLESMGNRKDQNTSRLAPQPDPKDIGRRPVPGFGSLAVEQIMPDPQQPRTSFPEEDIRRLADSIRDKGQLAPIRVRWSDELAKWIIVAGERRWRATKLAGLPTIECYFHTGDLSRGQTLEHQLIENLLREDLTPVDEARAYALLMQLNGWTGQQVAETLRVPASQVSRHLALLRLPEDVQHRVDAGEISARAGYELSRLQDESQQRKIADQAAAGSLTHEQAARAVRQLRGKRRDQPRGTQLCFPTEHGWKVVVSARRKGTYHEVEQAIEEVLAEVRHRIRNRVQIY